jgi:hypothetical protein
MLDDFRKQASDTTDFGEEPAIPTPPPVRPDTGGRFLGMLPSQRFFIALMLLVIVCLLSALCLLVTGRIVPFVSL